jgi:hypothetical protein
MSELKTIGNKLFKTELSSQKIELGVLQDLQSLFEKAANMIKEANTEKQKLKTMYSRALIILDHNIPAQADAAIKKAIDLDAMDVADKFKKIKSDSQKLTSDYNKIYNSL